jgi:hypothetical protein
VPDDWEWFWSSEYGRDRLLREEVESLSYQASAASSRANRMQSQLAQLQGSLESRLTALSKAFDAYVELGDVREQLAGYPDTSAIRRDVMGVIEQLSSGLPARPVDPRGLDYWLPYAANAVIEIVSGTGDHAGADPAASGPEAKLFIVAAVGALGHGDRVADRLPELLITDREFTGNQVILLDAVVAGVYGPVLDSLEPAFRPMVQRTDPAGWKAWIEKAADSNNEDRMLSWLRAQLVDPNSPATPDQASPDQAGPDQAGLPSNGQPDEADAGSAPDSRAPLRQLVSSLTGSGYGDEGSLLARSRELRWQIEHPGQTRPESEQGPAPVDALDRLRHHVQTLPPGSPEHQTLIQWLAPGLLTAIDPLAAAPQRAPAKISVRTYYGQLEVTASGPDSARLPQILANVELSGVVPPGKLYGYGIAAGVLAVLALVLALTGQPVVAVLAIVAAVVCGVLCILQLRARQEATEAARVALDQVNQQVTDGVDRAKQADLAAIETAQERARLADHLRHRLNTRLTADAGRTGDASLTG